METTFLDYYKIILDKVSFDEELFLKEYKKAMEDLHSSDKFKLRRWIVEKRKRFSGKEDKLESVA